MLEGRGRHTSSTPPFSAGERQRGARRSAFQCSNLIGQHVTRSQTYFGLEAELRLGLGPLNMKGAAGSLGTRLGRAIYIYV